MRHVFDLRRSQHQYVT